MKERIQQVFGKTLRKYRLQQKLSQESLAELANLDRTYISQIERGLKSPSIPTLISLAKALKIKACSFIAEVEEEMSQLPAQEG